MNPNGPVYVDTFMYVALLARRDNHHDQAVELAHLLADREMITSEPVLVEVLNTFARWGPGPRQLASELIKQLRADSQVFIEPQTPELFEEGRTLFESRTDKEYSLTDCMSMVVAERYGVTEIATEDKGFSQAGFNILF